MIGTPGQQIKPGGGLGVTFLFSSDFHSSESVFKAFAQELAQGPYAAGLLGGDLLDEWMPPEEVDAWLGSSPGHEDPQARLTAALVAKQRHLQSVLEAAGKPIFFVLGNHDVTPWPDSALLTNLHGRAVVFQGQKLAGYRWTRMDRYPHEVKADLPALAALVDADTLLLTHSPPWGVLDGVPGGRFRFGLKTLNTLAPRLHLFGHAHEFAGMQGRAVNGAWPALRKFVVVDASVDSPRPAWYREP